MFIDKDIECFTSTRTEVKFITFCFAYLITLIEFSADKSGDSLYNKFTLPRVNVQSAPEEVVHAYL